MPTGCRRRQAGEKCQAADMPTYLTNVEEDWQMRIEVPTCRPAYAIWKEADRRKVPACRPAYLPTGCRRRLADEKRSANLRDVEGGEQKRSAGLPTCLPVLKERSQIRREVPTCRPAYQMKKAGR